jgi:hypothetical protein
VAIDSDESISLPQPPPPRPAARRTAIEAALRKFDGAEEAPPRPVSKGPVWGGWAASDRRRAMGALATVALIAVVSVPLALTTLRDNEPPSVTPSGEAPAQSDAIADPTAPPIANRVANATVTDEPPSGARTPQSSALAPGGVGATASVADELKSVQAAPAPSIATTAPPPPPPPPPSPAGQFAEESLADSVVVTGSRIERPNIAKQGRAGAVAERQATSASPLAVIDTYGTFLSQLQEALRSNDRGAVIALVALPLRVNLDGQSLTYRSVREIERDFDRIFTPRVTQSVLNQRPETLRSRGSRMKGTSRIWFGQSSSDGTIRIREVTS